MTKKASKRSSLISKRSVLGDNFIKKVPKTLKPLRARQLIRRFHVLSKYKSTILEQLKTRLDWDEDNQGALEDNYKSYIKHDPFLNELYCQEWDSRWKNLVINKTPESVIDPNNNDKISNDLSLKDIVKVLAKLDAEITKRGGIEAYQTASTLGQDRKRGGDSSKLLVKWIRETNWNHLNATALEIGCLSSENEITTSKLFKHITRIDLHSQEPGTIIKQDFLKMPEPKSTAERFNLVSCSLVLNFVPTPEKRGEMLRRICRFLKEPTLDGKSLLFVVLPLPCVENSRYCDLPLITLVFSKLGFKQLKFRKTSKLAYWLLEWHGSKSIDTKFILKKKEIRAGKDRNNFSIVIK
ncbi:hypothetical protein CANINC_002151 [Pichia inconspicua]|uniref:25S rRNA adenine-N(1) methyltransferase n=1 Tax=Pichia inconspicua TaxID=52247 RepID=A0A4V4NFS3_9ASCO|nr:hypothetical protein CANINC_002151 [[Candida] inconspicua]